MTQTTHIMARAIDALTTDQATLSMVYKKIFEKKQYSFVIIRYNLVNIVEIAITVTRKTRYKVGESQFTTGLLCNKSAYNKLERKRDGKKSFSRPTHDHNFLTRHKQNKVSMCFRVEQLQSSMLSFLYHRSFSFFGFFIQQYNFSLLIFQPNTEQFSSLERLK